MPNTYVALATQTVATATSSVTFSSIPSGYTDLVLVISNATTTVTGYSYTYSLNNDTGSNYSLTLLDGNGSAAQSVRYSNVTNTQAYLGTWTAGMSTTEPTTIIVQLMNYSNATTYKTSLCRSNTASRQVDAVVGLWRSTAAVNRWDIQAQPGANIGVGSTFSLYGIANADQGAAKATGGIITEDSTYWYHTFGASGAFIPKQALTADILVVAGGGASGSRQVGEGNCAGGGAGGLRNITSQSLSSGVSYTCTIGSGGAANGATALGARGGSGNTSSFSGSGFTTINASGGGGGGAQTNLNGVNLSIQQGGTGGSGGGSAFDGSGNNAAAGAAGNTGSYSPVEGYAGGNGGSAPIYYVGGGGGAGGVGVGGTTGNTGGPGITYSNGLTYAKGGDGQSNTGPGTASTGNGGNGFGGGNAGGSGVVVIRYAK
jgi:hypothetical protein